MSNDTVNSFPAIVACQTESMPPGRCGARKQGGSIGHPIDNMLSAQDNERLTRVAAGTPMGELLRRYWQPIAPSAQLDERQVLRLRLFGEDLVLFKDGSRNLGLLSRRCPHRGADLSRGWTEKRGIRCGYHGWVFDERGACIEQPFEQAAGGGFCERVQTTSYPVRELHGLLWAYLGPPPVPTLCDWDFFYTRGYRYVRCFELPCNWLQCQENSIDPVHFEWLHDNWTRRLGGRPYGPKCVEIDFREFEYGFTYCRVRQDATRDDEAWTIGRTCLWPNGFFTEGCVWYVPVDDKHTLCLMWDCVPVPGDRPVDQAVIPYWHEQPGEPNAGPWAGEPPLSQDFAAMVGQGDISDRTRERLGRSDRGVTMLRNQLFADLERVASGQDPKGIVRSAQAILRLAVPAMTPDPDVLVRGSPPEYILTDMKRVRAEHVIHGPK